jgi:plastocyanin
MERVKLQPFRAGSLFVCGCALLVAALPPPAPGETAGAVEGAVRVRQGQLAENTVVYLRGAPPGAAPSEANPLPVALMDQQGNVFQPHILAVRRGQPVRFGNQDPVTHNVHIHGSDRNIYNEIQVPGGSSDWTPARAGSYVVRCDIHPEMLAFVLVFDHPFFADAGPGSGPGDFRIERVPPGAYTLVAVRSLRGKLVAQEQPVRITSSQSTNANFTF